MSHLHPNKFKQGSLWNYICQHNIWIDSHLFKTVKLSECGWLLCLHPQWKNQKQLAKTIWERISQMLTEVANKKLTNGNITPYFEIWPGHVHQRQLQSNRKYQTVQASALMIWSDSKNAAYATLMNSLECFYHYVQATLPNYWQPKPIFGCSETNLGKKANFAFWTHFQLMKMKSPPLALYWTRYSAMRASTQLETNCFNKLKLSVIPKHPRNSSLSHQRTTTTTQ